jgi:MFS family permease
VNGPRPALLVALIAGAVLSPLNSTMIAAAMPRIEHDFGIDAGAATAWLVGGYLLVSIVALAPMGRLADLIGHRVVFGIGLGLTAAGALCAIASPHFAVLVVGRLLMGVGGSCIVPTAMAMMRLAVSPEGITRALGAFGSLMASAAAIGPFLGGAIVQTAWGWHAVFLANVPLIGLAALLSPALRAIPLPEHRHPRFDLIGSLLLGVGLAALVAAVKTPAEWRLPSLALGLVALAVFVWHERRDSAPVVDLALFRAAPFAGGGAIVALHNLAMYSLLFALPHLLGGTRVPLRDGAVLAAMTGAMVVSGPLGGRVAARIGARATTLLSSLVAAAGTLALAWALPTPLAVAGCLAIAGIGIGLASGPSQAAALAATPRERSGTASAALSIMRYLGGLIGSAVLAATLPEAGAPHDPLIFVAPFVASLLAAAVVARALPGRVTTSG